MGSKTQVCDNHFRLSGVGYLRGHGAAVQLGDNGRGTAVASSPGSTFACLLLAPNWGAEQPHQRSQAWAEDLWRRP